LHSSNAESREDGTCPIDRALVSASRCVAIAVFPPVLVLGSARCPRLDLIVAELGRILNSEIALCYRPGSNGQPPVISSWGLGPPHWKIARSLEGGLVGRALRTQRAALEPLQERRGRLTETERTD
jgi:hypothetical protein